MEHYLTCPVIQGYPSSDIIDTEWVQHAIPFTASTEVMWARGVLLSPHVHVAEYPDAATEWSIGEQPERVSEGTVVGMDGSGGKHQHCPHLRRVGGLLRI